jgi:hypothetical protein
MTTSTKARMRYIHQAQSLGDAKDLTRWQIKHSGNSWGPDWSLLSRNPEAQIEFADFIHEKLRPKAIAVLNTTAPISANEFHRRLRDWRIASGNLHRGECPRRRDRKLEYIAAIEHGFNPRRAATGRLHAHVLLFNLGSIRLCDLGQTWRDLNKIKDPLEPLIEKYRPGTEGILYCLKSFGSDADMISFSPKLSLPVSPSAAGAYSNSNPYTSEAPQ